MASKVAFIYGLSDPRDGRIKYVGQSTDPYSRLTRHSKDTSNPEKTAWLRELKRLGKNPIVVILDQAPVESARTIESVWASRFRELTNSPQYSRRQTIAVRLDPELWLRAKHRAIVFGMSAQDFVSDALRKYLEVTEQEASSKSLQEE